MEEKNHTEILLYSTADGGVKIEILFEGETFWTTQKKMAELFGVDVRTVNEHLQTIFKSGELDENSVIRKIRTTAADGKNYPTQFYSLDAIIAVGYRVNSHRATQFRIWATQTLKEFLLKGFVLDDGRMKQGKKFGRDYFDELLERIRDIRASERRFYQKITDIYALSADYDKNAELTKGFFAAVQNKLHWAITGKTAAETIYAAADASKLNMGLTNWKGGSVRKGDVTVAKNYLTKPEIEELNRIVVMFLDYAEDQARRRKQVFISDWTIKLDEFLRFNDRSVLPDAGSVSREQADAKAKREYEKFSEGRRTAIEAQAEQDMIRDLENIEKKLKKTKDN